MDEALKPTSQCREIEIYNNYYKIMKGRRGEKINDFNNRFEKEANITKRSRMELTTKVKGLKVLNDAGLTEQDMKRVLTEVKLDDKEEFYSAAKTGLAKYIRNKEPTNTPATNVEPVMSAQTEEALIARGWAKQNSRGGKSLRLCKQAKGNNTTKPQSAKQQAASQSNKKVQQEDLTRRSKPENQQQRRFNRKIRQED